MRVRRIRPRGQFRKATGLKARWRFCLQESPPSGREKKALPQWTDKGKPRRKPEDAKPPPDFRRSPPDMRRAPRGKVGLQQRLGYRTKSAMLQADKLAGLPKYQRPEGLLIQRYFKSHR